MKIEIDYTPPSSSINHHFTFGKDLSEILNAGIKCAKEGSRSEARHLLLQVTEADCDNETAWLWLASISEYPEELLVFLQNVLRINPDNQRAIEWMKGTKSLLADTFVRRGIEASEENRKEFANHCFMQALLHDSQNEMAWLWLASNSDSPEEKKAHLQRVLQINPENETALASLQSLKHQVSETLLKRANFAAISGDRQGARQFLEEAMKDAPEVEEAWILKAYLADQENEKIACYEKVLALNPENEAAAAGLAAVKSLMQKSNVQKTNADMLQEVLEASGAEVLTAADSSFDFSQSKVDSATHQATENLEIETEQFVSRGEKVTPEKFVAETFNVSGAEPESFDNPTEELNCGFVQEVESGEVLAEESLGQSFAVETFSEEVELAREESENPVFAFNGQNDEALADEDSNSDDVLQFVEEAEARLFENGKTESLQLEDVEELQVEDAGESEDFEEAYFSPDQLPKASADENFEISAEMCNEERTSPLEALPLYEENSSSNIPESAEQNFLGQASFEADNLRNEAPTSEEMQGELSVEGQEELPDEEDARRPGGHESEVENADSSAQKYFPHAEPAACTFCYVMNEPHAVVCCSCRAMLSLADLETLLSYTEADPQVLEMAIEDLENEMHSRRLSADELMNLGIAYLQAKNLRKAFNCLQEASQMSPNDVMLASKVNHLAIRLSEIEAQESKTESGTAKNLTVMVVDDSPTVRKLISGKLEKCGHTVVTAADGAEALGKIKQVVPDLILLDIMMPQMDGYQVCKMIRSNEPTKNVPVVMISGKDGFFDKVRGRLAGTNGYITKPFGPETLMRTIETYVP